MGLKNLISPEIVSFFNSQCAYCGTPLDSLSLTIDHFIPKCGGGGNSNQNLLPCCSKCNQSKANLNPWVWFKSQSFFSMPRWTQILTALQKNHYKVIKKKTLK